jgi:hypothetical protein
LQIAAFVPKPFSFAQLSHAVGRVFRASHNAGWGPRAASGPVTQCPPRHSGRQVSFDLPRRGAQPLSS